MCERERERERERDRERDELAAVKYPVCCRGSGTGGARRQLSPPPIFELKVQCPPPTFFFSCTHTYVYL